MFNSIFLDFRNDSLLPQCLHGKTEKSKQSMNNVTQIKCPKNVYVQRNDLEMGVSSAVTHLSYGKCDIAKFKMLAWRLAILLKSVACKRMNFAYSELTKK